MPCRSSGNRFNGDPTCLARDSILDAGIYEPPHGVLESWKNGGQNDQGVGSMVVKKPREQGAMQPI